MTRSTYEVERNPWVPSSQSCRATCELASLGELIALCIPTKWWYKVMYVMSWVVSSREGSQFDQSICCTGIM